MDQQQPKSRKGPSKFQQWALSELDAVIANFPHLDRQEVLEQIHPFLEKLVRGNKEKVRKQLDTHSIVNRAILKLGAPDDLPDDAGSLYGFLLTIVRRSLVDRGRSMHGRRGNRPKSVSLEQMAGSAPGSDDDGDDSGLGRAHPSAPEALVMSIEHEQFEQAMEQLAEKQPDAAEIVKQRALGFSRADIATKFDLTSSMVRTQEDLAMKFLKDRLKGKV